MPRGWLIRIHDILDAVEKILRYTDGIEFAEFEEDDRTVDAVVRNFQIIGEAARYIPEEIEDEWSNIPWPDMRGLRNIITHEYFGVDLAIIWYTVVDELPELIPVLEAIIDAQTNKNSSDSDESKS